MNNYPPDHNNYNPARHNMPPGYNPHQRPPFQQTPPAFPNPAGTPKLATRPLMPQQPVYGPPPSQPFTPKPQPPSNQQGQKTRKTLLFLLLLIPVVLAGVAGAYLLQRGQGVHLPGTHQAVQPTKRPLTPAEQQQQALQAEKQKNKDLVLSYVKKMTLDEKIGQTMMVEYAGSSYLQADGSYSSSYTDDLDIMLHDLHAGAVLIYQRENPMYPADNLLQLMEFNQAKSDLKHMQERASLPLVISVDEEGTNVSRLYRIYPDRHKSARDIRDSQSTTVAAEAGKIVAQDMLSVGLNMNLAPVVDVSKDEEGYIGWDRRAYGETPEDVIKYTGPYTKAMQQNGVVGCLKHFPGIGAVPKGQKFDPHFVLPTLDRSREQLEKFDFVPFKHFINSQDKWEKARCIMPTNILLPTIDPTYPAELSSTFVTQILRKDLGYDGMILTDSLHMEGVIVDGQKLDIATAVLMALKAGNDMTMGLSTSADMRNAIALIKAALNDGSLSQQRIDDAVTHILTLKLEQALITAADLQK